ncbi:unnamed protein product [Periconia digitata]|uniref:Haloacid dehalogenase n=1 Tax=Periconia digitata TaxID=1303443 RepID=A0A9W4UW57_9PLEO|nr:unnamed protein product [Periconia digitata]
MPIKAILFDFMGTCLDWHTSVLSSLPPSLPPSSASSLALHWRHQYFSLNRARLSQNLTIAPFDTVLASALTNTLASPAFAHLSTHFDETAKKNAIRAFHVQKAWDDVAPALSALKSEGYEIFVHANGSTRLQLNLVASSDLSFFDMLFSSEMLGEMIPAPASYWKVLGLIGRDAGEVVKVAAHVEDLRGARECGVRTVYVKRWSDDVGVEVGDVRGEFDAVLEGMEGLVGVVGELDKEG